MEAHKWVNTNKNEQDEWSKLFKDPIYMRFHFLEDIMIYDKYAPS